MAVNGKTPELAPPPKVRSCRCDDKSRITEYDGYQRQCIKCGHRSSKP